MSNYRGRGGRGGRGGWSGRGASSTAKGSFLNGTWHCDCDPKLPAVHFQVKKEGPNKGRWFRTCQKPQDERCSFFLWDSDSHPRENAALANNSRTEPGRATTTSRGQHVASPPPPYTPEAGSSDASRKRTRAMVQEEEDEFNLDGNEDFEQELDQVMTAADTPSKRPRTDAFETPSRPTRRRLPWQTDETPIPNALPTPQTRHKPLTDPFPTRFAGPGGSMLTPSRYRSSGDPQTITPSSSPNETPTPSRFKDFGTIDNSLVRDVLGVLCDANVQMNDQTKKNLTSVLSRHATVTKGVKKGRDVLRTTISARDAKVNELTYRVDTLVAELEAEKAKVGHLQWTLEHGEVE